MTVNCLPDIGNKPDWLEIALLIVISQIIGLYFPIQHEYRLGKNVLAKLFDVFGECFLADSKNQEANVTENQLVGLVFLFLGLTNEPTLVLTS